MNRRESSSFIFSFLINWRPPIFIHTPSFLLLKVEAKNIKQEKGRSLITQLWVEVSQQNHNLKHQDCYNHNFLPQKTGNFPSQRFRLFSNICLVMKFQNMIFEFLGLLLTKHKTLCIVMVWSWFLYKGDLFFFFF